MARNSQPKLGKVAYRVCGPEGEVDQARTHAAHALMRAQRIAEVETEDALELRVVADHVVGPSKELYRVVRDGEGTVTTHIVSNED